MHRQLNFTGTAQLLLKNETISSCRELQCVNPLTLPGAAFQKDTSNCSCEW